VPRFGIGLGLGLGIVKGEVPGKGLGLEPFRILLVLVLNLVFLTVSGDLQFVVVFKPDGKSSFTRELKFVFVFVFVFVSVP
jgi:hypothetical protein